MSAETIARRLGEPCRSGSWWRCRCPAHHSAGSTLALRDGPSGLLIHCHAGCLRDNVLDELRRLGLFGVEDTAASSLDPDPAEIERQRAAEERRRQRRIAAAL